MTIGKIYKLTCSVTETSYIGKTIREINVRMSGHRDKSSNCRRISNAIKKYGWDNFQLEILWEGDPKILGEMERKFIKEYNTLSPNGYNLREGGGKSERISDESRTVMISKQREISKRRNGGGLLGSIVGVKSMIDDRMVSWRFIASRDGVNYTFASSKNKEDLFQVQIDFTNDPDGYIKSERINSERVKYTSKKDGIWYRENRNRWIASSNGVYLGSFLTEEDSINAKKSYEENPDNFILPKGNNRDDLGVTFEHSKNKWVAKFYKDKVHTYLGAYETKEEAISARKIFMESPDTFVRPNERVKDRHDVGITFEPSKKKWLAKFHKDKKRIYLGSYQTKEEAICARKRFIDSPDTFVPPNKRRKPRIN